MHLRTIASKRRLRRSYRHPRGVAHLSRCGHRRPVAGHKCGKVRCGGRVLPVGLCQGGVDLGDHYVGLAELATPLVVHISVFALLRHRGLGRRQRGGGKGASRALELGDRHVGPHFPAHRPIILGLHRLHMVAGAQARAMGRLEHRQAAVCPAVRLQGACHPFVLGA